VIESIWRGMTEGRNRRLIHRTKSGDSRLVYFPIVSGFFPYFSIFTYFRYFFLLFFS
jgi:hypothetical protein